MQNNGTVHSYQRVLTLSEIHFQDGFQDVFSDIIPAQKFDLKVLISEVTLATKCFSQSCVLICGSVICWLKRKSKSKLKYN